MKFDFESIDDFEKHIQLSIPDYNGLMDTVENITLEYLTPDGALFDIGSSSGRLLNKVSLRTDARLYGCDLIDMGYEKKYNFIQGDFIKKIQEVEQIDVISCCFTLQFLGKRQRKEAIEQIKRKIKKGAVALIAEKIHLDDSRLNTAIYRAHSRSKLKGFTAKDIMSKDHSLCGAMFPQASAKIQEELDFLGANQVIWQSYNFKCWFIQG